MVGLMRLMGIAHVCLALAALNACSAEENLGFSAVGSARWAVSLGGRGNDDGVAVAVDGADDVIVGGQLNGGGALGWCTDANACGFVTKRASNDGSERWTIALAPLTASGGIAVNGVAVDADDDVVITGGVLGAYDLGGVQLSGDSSAMFVAKYTTSGQLVWAHRLESAVNVAGESVVVGATGMIFATGNGLVAAYTPDGMLGWVHEFQGPTIQNQYNLGIVPNGSIVFVGTLYGPASLGGDIIEPSLAQQTFVAQYTQDGAFVASTLVQAGSYQDAGEARVAIDRFGTIVVTDIERNAGPETCVDVVHALDGELAAQWSSQTHSDCTIFRTLATAPSGAILRGTWNNDAIHGQDEAMRVSAYTRTGSVDESTFGHRLRVAPQISGVEGSAIGGRDTVAFTGHFGGSIDFGSGPLVTSGTDDADAFIVAVSAHAEP
jgi:hypothetical protein